MAIYSPSISDDVINTLLTSPDKDMVALGKQYQAAKTKQDEELGRDKGMMKVISDLFGFGSAQGAEPNFNTGQNYSNRFSVTSPPQFETKPEVIVPGNIDMAESVFANYPYLKENTETTGINKVLTPEQQLQLYLQSEGGDAETDVFKNRNIFQKSFDFLRDNPAARFGLGALIGGPAGAAAGFFANKIGGGIADIIRNFRNRGKDVEMNLPQVIQTGSEFVDEFGPSNDPNTVGGSSRDTATGGTFGSSVDDASTFSDYS